MSDQPIPTSKYPAPTLTDGDNRPIPDDAPITLSATALRELLHAYGGKVAQAIVDAIVVSSKASR